MEEINYRPLGRRVVAKRLPKDTGGFAISAELQREGHPDVGIIIAVGDLLDKDKFRGLEVGVKIYYTRYSPVKIPQDNGEELDCYFVDVKNILGLSITKKTNE